RLSETPLGVLGLPPCAPSERVRPLDRRRSATYKRRDEPDHRRRRRVAPPVRQETTMTLTASPAPVLPPRPGRAAAAAGPRHGHTGEGRGGRGEPPSLARYLDWRGSAREVVAERGCAGSVLVVDRDASGADVRLVAHLGADEPPENAALVCRC